MRYALFMSRVCGTHKLSGAVRVLLRRRGPTQLRVMPDSAFLVEVDPRFRAALAEAVRGA